MKSFTLVSFVAVVLSAVSMSAFASDYFIDNSIEYIESENLTSSLYTVGSLVQVLHVSSDALPGYLDVSLRVDGDLTVSSLRYYTSDNQVKEFEVSQLSTGIVLFEKEGHEVVKLVSKDFDPRSGGHVDLVYLSNALEDDFQTFSMELVRRGKLWTLEAGGKAFTSMFMQKRDVFGMTVGIEKIIVK